jgi:hypothetical protein
MTDRVKILGATLDLPAGWVVVSDALPGGSDVTIARTGGVGSLKLSIIKPPGDPAPRIELEDLEDLLRNFADNHGLAEPLIDVYETRTMLVAADFWPEGEYMRVWYGSNGAEIMLVTYFSEEPDEERVAAEVVEAEEIVASAVFSPAPSA